MLENLFTFPIQKFYNPWLLDVTEYLFSLKVTSFRQAGTQCGIYLL